jgi:hypothetical protein
MKVEVDSSDLLKIHDALGHARKFFVRRDEMNAAVHLGQPRYSPITSEVEAASDRLLDILTDAGVGPKAE